MKSYNELQYSQMILAVSSSIFCKLQVKGGVASHRIHPLDKPLYNHISLMKI